MIFFFAASTPCWMADVLGVQWSQDLWLWKIYSALTIAAMGLEFIYSCWGSFMCPWWFLSTATLERLSSIQITGVLKLSASSSPPPSPPLPLINSLTAQPQSQILHVQLPKLGSITRQEPHGRVEPQQKHSFPHDTESNIEDSWMALTTHILMCLENRRGSYPCACESFKWLGIYFDQPCVKGPILQHKARNSLAIDFRFDPRKRSAN